MNNYDHLVETGMTLKDIVNYNTFFFLLWLRTPFKPEARLNDIYEFFTFPMKTEIVC